MKKFYTTYELVERLDAIPTVQIQTFEEPFHEGGMYQSEIKIHFPDEFDKTAFSQVKSVVETASTWEIDTPPNPESEITVIYLSASDTLPLQLLENLGLN